MVRGAALVLGLLPGIAADFDATSVEQVGLTYGGEIDEMVVTFASFDAPDELTECKYGPSADDLSMSAATTVTQYSMREYTSPSLYTSTLTNLPIGNEEYYYSCGSSNLGFTPPQSFKTHPGPAEDVTFFVLGDVGQTSNSVNTIDELVEYEDLLTSSKSGGIISMGDLSYANGNQPLWDSFGNLRQKAAAKIPFQTTLGNHEWLETFHDFTAYQARFRNPNVTVNGVSSNELYYSFNAGLVHFVMVAGYCPEMRTSREQPCLAEGSTQLKWLKEDLSSVDRQSTPWVVVAFHQPYVNSNDAHSISTEGAPMQEAIESTLYENKVDLVFSGHVHAYERSCQVYQYKCTPGAPYYITIGDGGNKEGLATNWVEPQPDWSLFRQASYGFGELHVSNATHMHWSWHQNQDLVPTVADELTIVKTDGTRKQYHLRADQRESDAPAGVTSLPVFVNSERGKAAQKFDAMMRTEALEKSKASL